MADFRFPVEASHILMFARAIGDPNPVYADAEKARNSSVTTAHTVCTPASSGPVSQHPVR